jgi:hypothetical protein
MKNDIETAALTLSEIIQIAKDVFEDHVSERDWDLFVNHTQTLFGFGMRSNEDMYDAVKMAFGPRRKKLILSFRTRLDEAAQNKTSKNI